MKKFLFVTCLLSLASVSFANGVAGLGQYTTGKAEATSNVELTVKGQHKIVRLDGLNLGEVVRGANTQEPTGEFHIEIPKREGKDNVHYAVVLRETGRNDAIHTISGNKIKHDGTVEKYPGTNDDNQGFITLKRSGGTETIADKLVVQATAPTKQNDSDQQLWKGTFKAKSFQVPANTIPGLYTTSLTLTLEPMFN